jgi:RNA polymerase-binding transcription factor DksA
MNEHKEVAKALTARLFELRTHHAKVDRELHKALPADSEDRAIELENQETLEVIEKTETREINQIKAALNRISDGSYGNCAPTAESLLTQDG